MSFIPRTWWDTKDTLLSPSIQGLAGMFYLHVKFHSTNPHSVLWARKLNSEASWTKPCLSSHCIGKNSFFPGEASILPPLRRCIVTSSRVTAPRAESLDAGIGPGPTVAVSRGGQRAAHGAEPALGFAASAANAWEVAFCAVLWQCTGVLVSEQRPCVLGWMENNSSTKEHCWINLT